MLAIRCFVSYTSLKILSIALSKSEVQKVQNRKNPEFWEKVVKGHSNDRGGKPHSRLKIQLYIQPNTYISLAVFSPFL